MYGLILNSEQRKNKQDQTNSFKSFSKPSLGHRPAQFICPRRSLQQESTSLSPEENSKLDMAEERRKAPSLKNAIDESLQTPILLRFATIEIKSRARVSPNQFVSRTSMALRLPPSVLRSERKE
ncbi:hypothetical protein M9H77_32922 [Catharanthus roseus]|uniref:Uncharacterized protein n=1 Tax=Catharanthus roseus TaxID=4058 RepID=A0ACC0A496_CATRO|nr:hypothetical protein M9H77_32922 [Catharanthus roseus]